MQCIPRTRQYAYGGAPIPVYRKRLNALRADGHAAQIGRSEVDQLDGPSIPFQNHPPQNRWRDGAVPLSP